MRNEINTKAVSISIRGQIPVQDPQSVRQAAPDQKTDYSKYRTQKDEVGRGSAPDGAPRQPEQRKLEPVRVEKKVGRNDPCPCGSGKKYKNCHGQNG